MNLPLNKKDHAEYTDSQKLDFWSNFWESGHFL